MNGPTSVIFKALPSDWRATPMRQSNTPSRRRGEPDRPLDSQDPVRARGHRAGRGQPARGRGTGPLRGLRLLSDDRKDRLAEVYHAFARRARAR